MSFAMVFPGQGSQSLGMQAEFAAASPVVRDTWHEAGETLGYDLWALVQDGPQEELNRTVVTQPAMLTAGIAAWRAWRDAGGPLPACVAGHSLGEYVALVAAGALERTDALRLVRRRAELMQGAVAEGEGAMAAVLGLDDDTVVAVCEESANGEVVAAVNFNSPGQVVIAGNRAAVERAVERAKSAGAKRALMLRVSVPSHSPLMRPAGDGLAAHLAATPFAEPEFPVISSVDVTRYEEPDAIRAGLRAQVFSPVRWSETVRRILADGVDTLIECGPGKVLTGLGKRIERSATHLALEDPASLAHALEHCRQANDD